MPAVASPASWPSSSLEEVTSVAPEAVVVVQGKGAAVATREARLECAGAEGCSAVWKVALADRAAEEAVAWAGREVGERQLESAGCCPGRRAGTWPVTRGTWPVTVTRNARGSCGMFTMTLCARSAIMPRKSCCSAYSSMSRRSRASVRPASGGSRAPGRVHGRVRTASRSAMVRAAPRAAALGTRGTAQHNRYLRQPTTGSENESQCRKMKAAMWWMVVAGFLVNLVTI